MDHQTSCSNIYIDDVPEFVLGDLSKILGVGIKHAYVIHQDANVFVFQSFSNRVVDLAAAAKVRNYDLGFHFVGVGYVFRYRLQLVLAAADQDDIEATACQFLCVGSSDPIGRTCDTGQGK